MTNWLPQTSNLGFRNTFYLGPIFAYTLSRAFLCNWRTNLSANFYDVKQFAEEQFDLAHEGASTIKFSLQAKSLSRSEVLTEQYGSVTANALVDNPEYESLKQGYGKSVWSVMLAVDLRGSTSRAVEIGPKNTYLTMHTFLPTLINLVAVSYTHLTLPTKA